MQERNLRLQAQVRVGLLPTTPLWYAFSHGDLTVVSLPAYIPSGHVNALSHFLTDVAEASRALGSGWTIVYGECVCMRGDTSCPPPVGGSETVKQRVAEERPRADMREGAGKSEEGESFPQGCLVGGAGVHKFLDPDLVIRGDVSTSVVEPDSGKPNPNPNPSLTQVSLPLTPTLTLTRA